VWRETEVDRDGQYISTQTYETYIDLRERLLDFPHQSVITRDNVEIRVHPMALYRLVDPVKVAYEVYDLTHAVEKLVQTTLRSIIGDMGLDDTLASREEINKRLAQKVKHVCHNWGCELTRVELLEIAPASASIESAMHQQLQAERVRRSNVKRSDGLRIMLKTHAEGDMSAVVAISKGQMEVKKIKAKAEADSKLLVAKAEADSLEDVGSALADFGLDPSDYMCACKYVEAFQGIAAGAKKRTMFVPYETGVVGALNKLDL
jgi:regulator of protease activity HflC (stomatin/prohibitin superfamily)